MLDNAKARKLEGSFQEKKIMLEALSELNEDKTLGLDHLLMAFWCFN